MSFYPGINLGGFLMGSLISGDSRLATLDSFCSWRGTRNRLSLPYSVRGQMAQTETLTTYTFDLWVSFTFAVTSPKGHLIPNLPVCILSSRNVNGPINLVTWERMAEVICLSHRHKETWRLVRLLENRLCQFYLRLGTCLHLNLRGKDNAQHLIHSCLVFPVLC